MIQVSTANCYCGLLH